MRYLYLISNLISRLQNSKFKTLALFISNIKYKILRRPVRFFKYKNGGYYVKDNNQKHFFSDLPRGLTLYRFGLKSRAKELFDSYLLKNIKLQPNDVVIDCGANYGDLWLTLCNYIKPENYITFEPGWLEFHSLELNAPISNNNNIALSNTTGISTFFINETEADSSLIKPDFYTSSREVETLRLDDWRKNHTLLKIKLFKLEAEGFEPEILKGAEEALKACEYVALDGGPERGVDRQETLTECINFLLHRNFEVVEINHQWRRALFRNTKLS